MHSQPGHYNKVVLLKKWVLSKVHSISCPSGLCYRDRCRTTVNVLGDSFGTKIVERLSRGYLMSSSLATDNGGLEDTQSSSPQVDTTGNNNFELHKTEAVSPSHDSTKL